ncbi:hypothetical protein [Herbaspirillum sp. CAH-3]|uniref:hypothetical protein n=1 Tax=Herbaspirillum sp. CAH-3 TaxID=2605746 RepID=UPI00189D31FA|nr:hypothetical protein [Herbaspirillum sp. CAH-3]
MGLTEAARLAGVSRQHLYKLASSGQLRVALELRPGRTGETSSDYLKSVEISELEKVFGQLKSCSTSDQDTHCGTVSLLQKKLQMAHHVISSKDLQLAEAVKREQWLMGKLDEVLGAIVIAGTGDDLVDPQEVVPETVPKSQYDEMVVEGRKIIGKLKSEIRLLKEKRQPFWRKLFSKGLKT